MLTNNSIKYHQVALQALSSPFYHLRFKYYFSYSVSISLNFHHVYVHMHNYISNV